MTLRKIAPAEALAQPSSNSDSQPIPQLLSQPHKLSACESASVAGQETLDGDEFQACCPSALQNSRQGCNSG